MYSLFQNALARPDMTMSLFHNLKLKRRKVDSRSSSDGSEAAATEMMINPPSLASSSEMTEEPRPSSRHSSFDVEVKPNKFELHAPKYTSWASPAKLKQEPMYTDETPTLTATVVPKTVYANGSPTSTSSVATSSSSQLPSELPLRGSTSPATLVHNNVRPNLPVGGGHRLAEALRPPVTNVVSMAAHLPLAAAAAAAKLQAMHPNLVTSSAHPNLGTLQPPLQPQQQHHQPVLRMVTTPSSHYQPKPSPPTINNKMSGGGNAADPATPQYPTSSSSAKTPYNVSVSESSNGGPRKPPGPSVILGEHGGVKTMIWTDSTTYWQTANKYRNLHVLPSQQQQQPQQQQQQQQHQPPSLPPLPLRPQSNLHQPGQLTPIPPLPLGSRAVISSRLPPPPQETTLLMPPVASTATTIPTTSVALKIERPADHEQQLKMSSAVDGLLSLSSQGGVVGGRSPYTPIPAPPQMVQISPVHLSQGSNHPSPASTPARLSNSSVSSSPVPDVTGNGLNSSPQFNQSNIHQQQPPPTPRRRSPMNMERLWAGDMSQLPSHVLESQNGHSNASFRPNLDQEEEEPLLCNICEDRATGLHYGIITCEG